MMAFNANAYEHWANCGVGSTVTTEEITEISMDFGVLRNITLTRHTLLALDAEKATLEIFIQGAANGAPFEMKNTLELPARPPEEPGMQRASGGDENGGWELTMMTWEDMFKGSAPNQSTESLEVAGRSLVCRRIDRSAALHGQPLSMSFWWSDQVPGGLARMESRMGSQVTKTKATAFEKK
jgi:hypothetical protein